MKRVDFKVPITYALKEKFIRMLNEYSGLKGTDNERDISTILPRIGFNIEAINYDAERKRNTLSRRYSASSVANQIKTEFAEVPYAIDFFSHRCVKNYGRRTPDHRANSCILHTRIYGDDELHGF